jgi:8-oxo-dGTP pyrophosphatase MutT (NUDIX family)
LSKNVLISSSQRLRASNAVAAILVLEDGRYVMQLRDNIAGIFYPGHWGCFGGAVDSGERPLHALKRELMEEVEFRATQAVEFTRFRFDLRRLGQANVYRIYYEVPIKRKALKGLVLHEGKSIRVFSGRQLLGEHRVTPYDAFAILLHYKQKTFRR